jgi:Fur family transcriptional regulator, iron response regulator
VRVKISDLRRFLKARGINPSPQRLAVARYVLYTNQHPSADKVWANAKKLLPGISKASVYNALSLFVQKGLLRRYAVSGGGVVFDANIPNHHHFIELDSGRIHDLPWDSLAVSGIESLRDFEVREYHVVMRGRRMKRPSGGRPPRRPS